MNIDENKIDSAVLALLYLTLHDERRAWKGMDFEVMNRLHEKGYIDDPVNKNKSVWLTDEGLDKSEKLFKQLFSK
jgi:preprotein translocase subunit SecA